MNFEQKKQMNQLQAWKLSCTRMLPGFVSQLLLLLNSGMVLQTAFQRIAHGYESFPEKEKNQFMKEVCRIQKQSEQTGESAIRIFYRYSQNSGSPELIRVAGIMAASLDTGADLWDKLEEQGNALWESRKRLALEKIRTGESKMSFPLGILMTALLLVTASPALLQI